MNHIHKFFSYIHFTVWSTLGQFITCLTISILLIILGYSIDIKFLQKRLQALQKQAAVMSLSIRNIKQAAQQNRLQDAKSSPLVNDINALKTSNQVSLNLGVVDVLSSLEQALTETQVESYLFEPQTIKTGYWATVYPIKLEVRGGYENLIKYINALLKPPYLTVIEGVVIQKKTVNAGDGLNMQLLLAVYKEKNGIIKNSVRSASRGGIVIEIPKRDIFKRSVVGKNLFLWSNSELNFLGWVKQAEKIFGIINDPMGIVYRVAVGDKIGLNQSRIIAIDGSGITMENRVDKILRIK